MKRLISGIQPTGELTLGNYIGAIKEFVRLSETLTDTECFFFIADLHAITTPQERLELRRRTRNIAAIYLAAGLNPERVNLFVQSEIHEHVELSYIMESTSYIGEMERMTQFKDKKKKQTEGIRTSLLTYPALMAADILLYDATIVPVGQDQQQHLELTRTLAQRFNHTYGDTFAIPEGFTPKVGAKIMSLTEPTKKMSKSDSDTPKSYILLLDDLNTIKNKIKSAVTDSDTQIKYDVKHKPGISNLLTIYSSLTGLSIKDIEEKYKNETSYAGFKEDLAGIVVDVIKAIQDKYQYFIHSKELDEILDKGAEKARHIASRKIQKVHNKIGLGRKK